MPQCNHYFTLYRGMLTYTVGWSIASGAKILKGFIGYTDKCVLILMYNSSPILNYILPPNFLYIHLLNKVHVRCYLLYFMVCQHI